MYMDADGKRLHERELDPDTKIGEPLVSMDWIQELVDGSFVDSESGKTRPAMETAIAIEDSLDGAEVELVRKIRPNGRVGLIMDPDTEEALGNRVARSLSRSYRVTRILLPRRSHPDIHTVEDIAKEVEPVDLVVGVGSGTINDLAKYSAYKTGKAYIVFPTALSMNGYTSSNAAITVSGHKKSLPARPAAGVFIDIGVVAKAPIRLVRSGIGDSLCRSTAQSDWLLSHLVLDTPYDALPFRLLYDAEQQLLQRAEEAVAGDRSALEVLASLLILSGFGMRLAGGSYPASQGEHLISHYIEMFPPGGTPPDAYHGEQVAVTTLTMAAIQARLLSLERIEFSPPPLSKRDFGAFYGTEIGDMCWSEFEAKREKATVERVNQRLTDSWQEIRDAVGSVMTPLPVLHGALKAAGVPVHPSELGLPADYYTDAVLHAREIRDRFTFLDLALDSGQRDIVREAAAG